jgi:hypothetical protein
VVSVEQVLAPNPTVGHSSRRPAQASWGSIYTEYDTGRTYIGQGGTTWHLMSEPGEMDQLTLISGWNATSSRVYARRRNGLTYLQGFGVWAGANRTANTDITLVDLPTQYRPTGDIYGLFIYDGGRIGRFRVLQSTGQVQLINYEATFATGYTATLHPISWPSN